MKRVKYIFSLIVVVGLVFTACSKGDSGGGEEEVQDPTKAVLAFPDNNEECSDGVVISNTKAKIAFDWTASDHTNSYELFIKNLNDDSTEKFSSNTDNKEVTLDRGTPYSWYVVSKSNKTSATATSDTWKFYLSGEGVENYAPFPADLKSPANGASVQGTTVSIEWVGTDVDDDIKEYDVYLDTNASPGTKIATTSGQNLDNQSVNASTTYYWKIVTHDEHGNTSTSQTYSFITD